MNITKTYIKDLVYKVNGAAIEVHKALGPGLLESAYHKCIKKELTLRNINFLSEVLVNIDYKGLEFNTELRCDLFVEGILPVELKAVESIHPVYEAQLMTYMKLLKVPLGLLLNFNVSHLFREGQKTFVNDLYSKLPD